jgi:hypothetical protein
LVTSPRFSLGDSVPLRPPHPELIDDLLKLQKAAQQIGSILDLDQLIDKIVGEVALSFGCLEASIYLHDEARAEVVLAGVHGCTRHGKGARKKVG